MPAIPPPFSPSPEIQRRRKQILYWSYRRARPIWLAAFGLGVLFLFVGRTESDHAMGFSLLLIGGILALTGFVGFVAFEAVIWRDRVAFVSLSAAGPAPAVSLTPVVSCSHCGQSIPAGSPFCPRCGGKLG